MFKKVDPKMTFPKMEEEIIKFWEENKIFEKSIGKNAPNGEYVFYDGPPFATGTPHYGHIVASTMKDAVPRYWTMKGYRVERKWGWDCHGLPIENIAEKELGIKRKTEIEEMGVEKFNEFCRSKVLGYVSEWKKVITRLGRWADMENAYKTMDLPYMESIWWVFKELWEKGLIYEGYRSMHICTRCETTLSQQEVSEGYKDIKDLSATVKFELVETQDFASLRNAEEKTYILAWTTTPWTLIGNVALAVGGEIDYVKIKCHSERSEESRNNKSQSPISSAVNLNSGSFANAQDDSVYYILAKERLKDILKDNEYEIIEKIKGKDLIGKKYKPLFDYYTNKGLQNEENGWQIYAGDFVTTEEGTGVVHIAPAFGEDDLNLSYKYNLPFVQHVGMDGLIKKEATDFAGLSVKPMEDHQSTDVAVIKYLAKNTLLFAKEKYEHSYPHCWRCDTPLINYATSSWFVKVTDIKDRALELAKDINWSPKHIKEGRFGNWLEGARDWSISRQRYWASVMPIWKCTGAKEHREGQKNAEVSKGCGEMKVFGSVKELEEISGGKITDLHKHIVDKITFKCEKCNGEMKRIPDVLDTWFDSGSMPYAQVHYPFDPSSISSQCSDNYGAGNKEKLCLPKGFPADFIAEGVDQTRAWFYYLHIIATAIQDSRAYSNVVVNGIVLAEDGKKMSKRLNNYPDPALIFDKYGADALRFYLLSSPVMSAENLNFKESEVAELVRGMFRMLWNSYSFFVLYANIDKFAPAQGVETRHASSLLDKWIVSELNMLIKDVNAAMDNYELNRACRLFPKFIDNLSNWYIRRSRKRFWKSEDDVDKNSAYQTLHYVLVELSKSMAPFTPFIAEEIYRNLMGCHSERSEESRNNKSQSPILSAVNLNSGSFANAQDDSACSVHLSEFPVADEDLIDEKLNGEMEKARKIISEGLQLRAKAGIKVRQPLNKFSIFNFQFSKEIVEIIKDELNVKDIAPDQEKEEAMILDTEITEDLKLEGQAREIIRAIQEMRKEAGYEVDNRIEIAHFGAEKVFEKFGDLIAKEILATIVKTEKMEEFDLEKEFKIDDEKIEIQIKR